MHPRKREAHHGKTARIVGPSPLERSAIQGAACAGGLILVALGSIRASDLSPHIRHFAAGFSHPVGIAASPVMKHDGPWPVTTCL
jgi:hypothetical protein